MTDASANFILLPGLHGTGDLFPPFLQAMPAGWTCTTLTYPLDAAVTYDEWTAKIRADLPVKKPFIIIGESFSGPIAIKIAADPPSNLRAIVLVGTFTTNPVAPLPGWLVRFLRPVLRLPLPRFLQRRFLLAPTTPPDFVETVYQAVEGIPQEIVAQRIQTACSVDIREEFRRLSLPTLVLTGKHDRLIRRPAVSEFSRIRPDVEIVELDTPHLILQLAPRAAVAAIASFLKRLPTSEA